MSSIETGSEANRPQPAGESLRGPHMYPLAVIELGTSAIRMAIGETDGTTGVRVIEQLIRGVSLGKDTFTDREIHRRTVQQCIAVLKSYRRKLDEYQLTDPNHMRVVATSAVREATNRLEFLDRIYIATGLAVELIDDAEIARVTYLCVRPLLENEPELNDAVAVVAEVGGGNTEVLVLQGKDILHSQPYRLGSLRLQQMLINSHASRSRAEAIMTGQIDRTLEPLLDVVPTGRNVEFVALGGDVRLAARLLGCPVVPSTLQRIPVSQLEQLTKTLMKLTVDRIMRDHHLELSQAETLVPALLANVRAAKLLGCPTLLITGFNLRDALLQGMVRPPVWSPDFCDQIVNSALELARKYQVDLIHAQHVAELSTQLFRGLQSEHRMDQRCETLLYVAALLHETGLFVGTSAYHKHSFYLIMHSELFGLNQLDHTLVALIARYHRRAAPKPTHEVFARMDRDSRVLVSRLAGILRVAVALDQSSNQRVRDIRCAIERGRLIVSAATPAADLSLEQMALRTQATLLEDTFGLSVLLRESAR